MEQIAEYVIAFMLVMSGIFGLVGSYGLVKLPDQMTRLHAPTKAATLGVGGALIASFTWFLVFSDHASVHELLISLFIFVTAPITGLMIAKAHLHLCWRAEDLPDPGEGRHWATFGPIGERSLMDAKIEPESGRRSE